MASRIQLAIGDFESSGITFNMAGLAMTLRSLADALPAEVTALSCCLVHSERAKPFGVRRGDLRWFWNGCSETVVEDEETVPADDTRWDIHAMGFRTQAVLRNSPQPTPDAYVLTKDCLILMHGLSTQAPSALVLPLPGITAHDLIEIMGSLHARLERDFPGLFLDFPNTATGRAA